MELPQFEQKAAPGSFIVPHWGQAEATAALALATGWPQFPQKPAPSGSSDWQFGQRMAAAPSRGSSV